MPTRVHAYTCIYRVNDDSEPISPVEIILCGAWPMKNTDLDLLLFPRFVLMVLWLHSVQEQKIK